VHEDVGRAAGMELSQAAERLRKIIPASDE
jgi:hypothetical protein